MTRPVHLLRRLALAGAAGLVVAGSIAALPHASVAAEDDPPVVEITGRGWGHGRGMSQYGALGYAKEQGWSSSRILDHFYGGTTAGQAPIPGRVDPGRIRVDLISMTGRATTVALGSGSILLLSSDGLSIRSVEGAVRLTKSSGRINVETASSCDGPWTKSTSIDRTLVRLVPRSDADGQDGLLHVCGPSYRTWYDGEIWATGSAGRQRTINLVSVEQYLRGVVPNEVPALWPEAVLEAQAVAARSYALSGDPRASAYADTCDTTTCQVYDGRYTTRAGWRRATHPKTDAAIEATQGLVRLTSSGRVARTEFSSSSGGYTAGGDFPAVVDAGDSVAANSNHTWTIEANLTSLEKAYGKGALRSAAVTSRNGHGADGGRVLTVEYKFEQGTATVSGSEARQELGLKSDWFSINPLRRGTKPALQYAGVLVDDLYGSALGRAADGDGRTYWVNTMGDGLRYEQVGTLFYGSPEFVKRAGGTNEMFVASLYHKILGRAPDPDGRAYWVGLLNNDQATPADVAHAFYRSIESRRDRVRSIYRLVAAESPSSSTIEAQAERLLTVDDLVLAAEVNPNPEEG